MSWASFDLPNIPHPMRALCRYLLPAFLLLIGLGCKSQPDPTGKYRVEVPQSGGKVANVGTLELKPGGNFTMNSGQLQMHGTWSQAGGEVKFTSGDVGVQMLSSRHFRLDGNKLVPVGDEGDQNHWHLTKE